MSEFRNNTSRRLGKYYKQMYLARSLQGAQYTEMCRTASHRQLMTKNCAICRLNYRYLTILRSLKVKCNEIWTIFLLSKNLYKKVSYTIMKQNRLLKISFVRPAASKTRKNRRFPRASRKRTRNGRAGVETKL